MPRKHAAEAPTYAIVVKMDKVTEEYFSSVKHQHTPDKPYSRCTFASIDVDLTTVQKGVQHAANAEQVGRSSVVTITFWASFAACSCELNVVTSSSRVRQLNHAPVKLLTFNFFTGTGTIQTGSVFCLTGNNKKYKRQVLDMLCLLVAKATTTALQSPVRCKKGVVSAVLSLLSPQSATHLL